MFHCIRHCAGCSGVHRPCYFITIITDALAPIRHQAISNNHAGSIVTLHPVHRSHIHNDVIKWKHFPCYWPFVRGIHRFPVNSLHKGQWRGAFMFSLICAWINLWVNNREAGDLRRYRAHYDVIVMCVTHIVFYRNKQWPREIGRSDTCIILQPFKQSKVESVGRSATHCF